MKFSSAPLGEIVEIPRDAVAPDAIASGTTYVGLENITGDGEFSSVRTVEAGDLASTKFLFSSRHILYGKLRPYLRKIARPDFDGICSTDILPILPGRRVDRDYLCHFLRLDTSVSFAESRSVGVNLPRISPGVLTTLQVPLPPLEEQRRIAAILDKAEALRQKRRLALQKLDSLTQSFFIEIFGDLRNNPAYQLQEICSEINDCPHSTPIWTEKGVRCLRTTNLGKGEWIWNDERFVSEETYLSRSSRGHLNVGDIILSREGTVGIAAIVTNEMRACMGQRLVQVRPNRYFVTAEYLLAYLLRVLDPLRIGHVMVGSTAQHLNVKELRNLSIPVPSKDNQRDFSSFSEWILREKKLVLSSIDDVNDLFFSLQHRAFRGEL